MFTLTIHEFKNFDSATQLIENMTLKRLIELQKFMTRELKFSTQKQIAFHLFVLIKLEMITLLFH